MGVPKKHTGFRQSLEVGRCNRITVRLEITTGIMAMEVKNVHHGESTLNWKNRQAKFSGATALIFCEIPVTGNHLLTGTSNPTDFVSHWD